MKRVTTIQSPTTSIDRPAPSADLVVSAFRMRQLVQLMPDAVLVLDRDGRTLDANAAAAKVLHASLEDLRTSATSVLARPARHPDGRAFCDEERPTRRAMLSGVPQTDVTMVIDDGDDSIWLEVAAIPIGTVEDEGPVLLVTFRDVTEQRAGDLEIRMQASLLDAVGEAVIATDPDVNITFWNAAAERLYGYPAAEVLGRSIDVIVPVEQHHLVKDFSRLLADGKSISGFETTNTTADGSTIHIRVSITPRLDELGQFVGSIAVFNDITEQVLASEAAQADRQLAAEAQEVAEHEAVLREVAQRANRSKSEFLSRMSHELRTPLNAVLGFGQLLEMSELDRADDQDSVDHILRAGRHLLDLINEVLDISRIETGDLHLSVEPVSVLEAVQTAMDLIEPSAAKRSVQMSLRVEDECPTYVLGDRQRLLQVVLNLLSNAVKYNVEGGSIGIDVRRSSADRVTVAISDTGLGLSPPELDRLFVPFDRLGAENTNIEGTGVGLALSKGLVECMHGTMDVESTEGAGSTFRFALHPADEPSSSFERASLPSAPSETRPLVVLYVEDNLPNFRVVEGVLALRSDITLLSAMQGRMGLELARAHHPDLILLDVHLPDMDGKEVLASLRSDPDTSSTRVVVVSADATEHQVARMTAAGADHYLTKPFDLQRLLAIVDDLAAAG